MMKKTTRTVTTETHEITVSWQDIIDCVKEKFQCNYWIQNAGLYVEMPYGEKAKIDDEHPVIVKWEETKTQEEK